MCSRTVHVFLVLFVTHVQAFSFNRDEICEVESIENLANLTKRFVESQLEDFEINTVDGSEDDSYYEYVDTDTTTENSSQHWEVNNGTILIKQCGKYDPKSKRPVIRDDKAVVLNTCYPERSRNASLVRCGKYNFTSYSGYIYHNDKQYGDEFLHFWFFVNKEPEPSRKPLVIFLQATPTTPILAVNPKTAQQFSTKPAGNMVWLTYTIPSGFSHFIAKKHTNPEHANTTVQQRTIKSIVERTYFAIKEFLQIFADFAQSEVYLAGTFGAGIIIPHLMQYIDERNEQSNFHINLKGAMLLHGFVDMVQMIDYGKCWLKLGVIDIHTSRLLHSSQELARATLNAEKYDDLKYYATNLLEIDSYYGPQRENIANKDEKFYTKESPYTKFNKILHVGGTTYHKNTPIIRESLMTPVGDILPKLLNKYRILYCNGQLENVTMYMTTALFLNQLQWTSATGWYNAPRLQWKNKKKEMLAYWKNYHNLHHVLIRNAGHAWFLKKPKIFNEMFAMFTQDGRHGLII